jgi:hypothetical protein
MDEQHARPGRGELVEENASALFHVMTVARYLIGGQKSWPFRA